MNLCNILVLIITVGQLVFSDKDLALKTAKRVKGSRFKVFKSVQEAEDFSRLNAEHTFSSPMKAPKVIIRVGCADAFEIP